MNLLGQFSKQVLLKDLFPKKGHQSFSDYFFQCQLHIYGSIAILLVIFLSGFIFLGTYNGLQQHLISLEENPFASAILIRGLFSKQRSIDLKKELFFNAKTEKFVTKN